MNTRCPVRQFSHRLLAPATTFETYRICVARVAGKVERDEVCSLGPAVDEHVRLCEIAIRVYAEYVRSDVGLERMNLPGGPGSPRHVATLAVDRQMIQRHRVTVFTGLSDASGRGIAISREDVGLVAIAALDCTSVRTG